MGFMATPQFRGPPGAGLVVDLRGLAVCLSNLVGGCVLVLYGASSVLWLSAGTLVVWGVCASVFINYVVALLQEHTEPAMMGRVMSMYSLVFFVAMPIGYAQAGVGAGPWGAPKNPPP